MGDPYASHISTLTSVGNRARRILELGPGLYSTPLFLDYRVFPNVEKLVSVEHNQEWADRLRFDDPRYRIVVVPEPIETYLDTIDFNDFDFIFVDNSDLWQHRVKTIEYVSRKATPKHLVVIHDFEHRFYQEAARGFPNTTVDTSQIPHTAMVWKNA